MNRRYIMKLWNLDLLISNFQGVNDRVILLLESDDNEHITDHWLLPLKIQDRFKRKATGMGSCCFNPIYTGGMYLRKEIVIITFKL